MENELTIASTTQLLDVHSTSWSRATLDHFHIPSHWFSEPVKSGTKLGKVRDFPELAGAQVIAVPGHDTRRRLRRDAGQSRRHGHLFVLRHVVASSASESDTPFARQGSARRPHLQRAHRRWSLPAAHERHRPVAARRHYERLRPTAEERPANGLRSSPAAEKTSRAGRAARCLGPRRSRIRRT